ncbi:MAG: hypothetical protein KAQ94_00240 [Arcobacteraceae bacterium]|nr:hypothetical protein [Arcobacteraceae bacterium]
MLINEFLSDIEKSCSHIALLCVKHILNKVYKDIDTVNDQKLKELFSNYNNYNKYLNDYAGTIYNKHSSSVNNVYIEMCKFLDIDIDNQYTLEHVIIKLEKQEPAVILNLLDDDIKMMTIENFEEKLNSILSSKYYNNNKSQFQSRVDKLSKNLSLVKKALQL